MSQKLTIEEINQLKSLQSDYAKLIAELGQVEISILVLEKQIEQIKQTQITNKCTKVVPQKNKCI